MIRSVIVFVGMICAASSGGPAFNIMDWAHAGRVTDGSTIIDKRQSADSTAYVLSHLHGNDFNIHLIEVRAGTTCWTGRKKDRGVEWTRHEEALLPCLSFDTLSDSYSWLSGAAVR